MQQQRNSEPTTKPPTFLQGLMQEQMRTNDVALRNIETIPGGYDQLRRMFESTTEAFQSAQDDAGDASSGGQPTLEQMLGGMGLAGAGAGSGAARGAGDSSAATPATGPNAAPLPNPWSSGTGGGGAAGGLGGAGGAGGLADLLGAMGGGGGGMGGMGRGANMVQNPQMQENAMRMMQNPQMQQMVTQMMQNPQMQQMLLQQNPQMRDAVEANPTLRNLIFSPEVRAVSCIFLASDRMIPCDHGVH